LIIDNTYEYVVQEATVTSSNYILIADDDQNIRMLLVRLIQNVAPDAEVVKAKNGVEALSALQHYAFGLIITDYHMPGASALDILSSARAQDPWVPVVVVSARPQVESSVLAAGATAFFAKPFEIEPFSSLLQQLLYSR
jgi:CheY-like chemotaxis protein